MLTRSSICMLLMLTSTMSYADESAGFSMVDSAVFRMGKETSGHVSMCVMQRGGRPIACFGLDKQAAAPARYTYFAIFKQPQDGVKETDGIQVVSEADGKTTKTKATFDVGEQDITLSIVRKLNEKTGAIIEETLTFGDQPIKKGTPPVFLVDASGDKVKVIALKAELPKTVPDLADESQDTWAAAIDQAVAEVVEKSAKGDDPGK